MVEVSNGPMTVLISNAWIDRIARANYRRRCAIIRGMSQERNQEQNQEQNQTQHAADESAQPSAYELIGGEQKLRELVDRFYDLMELEPKFAGIRAMHPTATAGSRDKLFWFLSGWMGGPNLYIERLGHPRLRARHLPYAIASDERDQWLR